jgi:DNA-binding MarR family transcriptional regulator
VTETTPVEPGSGPPPPSVSFFLINLGRRVRETVDARLREQGLAYQHLSALGHLRRSPGLSYSELARRGGVTVQSMQTTVTHLVQQGLVAAGGTTVRGRRADLQVTAQGERVLRLAEAAVRSVDDELLAGFTAGERASLEGALLRVFAGRVPRG